MTPWGTSSGSARGVRQGLLQWLPIESPCPNRGQLVNWWIHLLPPAFSFFSMLSSWWFCLPLTLLFGRQRRCNSNCFQMGKKGSCHYWQKRYLCILDYLAYPSVGLSPPPGGELTDKGQRLASNCFDFLLSLTCCPWIPRVGAVPLVPLCLKSTS